MFDVFRLWFGAILCIFRNRRSLVLENLALPQQLAVLKRKHPRPRLGPLDKLFWVLARRFYGEALLAVPQDRLTFAVIAEGGGSYVGNVYGGKSLTEAMSELVFTVKKSDLPSGPLLRSLRAYVVQNFNGPRCNTSKTQKDTKNQGSLPSALAS